MKTFYGLNGALLVLGVLSSAGAIAEDTDIFLESPGITSGRPNVLLVLDNAASNNSNITLLNGSSGTKLKMLEQVLENIVDPMNSSHFPSCVITEVDGEEVRAPADCVTRAEVFELLKGINLGLMLANPSGADTGGYVRYHIRPMDVESNRAGILGKIKNDTAGIPQANNAPYAKTLHEAYLYFGGKPQAYAGFSSAQYDSAAKSGNGYVSPISDSCQKNYIIFVGNGGPDSGEENDTQKLLGGVGATAVAPSGILTSDPVSFTPNNYTSSWFDEYARTLFKRDVNTAVDGVQNVVSYTIAVQNPADNKYSTNPEASARKLLESGAALGGGEYFEAHNGQAVLQAFINLLRKMQAVDSVFSSSTLPVSVNVRGTFLNQVYMGQFRPDANAKPRWPGNLKQYQIALDVNGNPILADKSSAAVEDKVNGFLRSDVTSFWTTPSTYWTFDPMGNPPSSSDAPDGATVEKGGVAQRMRSQYATSQSSRQLYTCTSCSSGSELSSGQFATSNVAITTGLLGAADSTERDDLINWVRGADNRNNEDGNNISTDVRARIHGDLVHSRPAVVNYNRSPGDRDIVVYYGTNSGVFHAVKGGQDDSDGLEKWGFIFPEHFAGLRRLRENSPEVSTANPKPAFADGPVTVYQLDANSDGKVLVASGDKVYLYVGMRRGGRFIYAFDVTDPDTPKYLWKVDNTMTGFSELGQSWSALRPAKIRAVANDPVVIFGGGYDPENEDTLPAGTNTKGRGIFVVNGRTGALVKHLLPSGMGSVPADLTVLDRNDDGNSDRIYAADTKGGIWRIDIDDANPDNWSAYKLASIAGSGANERKFLNKPDVVFGSDYDAVLVGSGDREKPFDTSVQNRFYMIKDSNVGLAGGLLCATGDQGRACTETDLADVTSAPPADGVLPAGSKGWFLTLSASGEKAVSGAVTVFGTTFFTTNRPTPPAPGVCSSNLGEARLYAVGFEVGGPRLDLNADGVIDEYDLYEVVKGGGFLPQPVYSPVEIDGKTVDVVCTGSKCFSPGASKSSTERYRTYWYVE
ncbi:pilus assembly protein [Pseudomonas sp. SP16.1]|uniref:pilus assembly protein n=1 Tax=Pseudomonas sp. SP16.1 TaxID=3458854 RepID=UPI0040460003